MPEADWPLTVRLNPGGIGLDSFVVPPPKYEQLEPQGARRAASNVDALSRDSSEQQQQLIMDLVCILAGGEGNFIRYSETFDPAVLDDKLSGAQYKLPRALDPSLRDVTTRLTDVAGSAYAVRTFADHYGCIEYGKVNQALTSAFRVLYNLYLSLVAEIESQWAGDKHRSTVYLMWIKLEPFAPHLLNARQLILRFMEASKLARERKRLHGALDLVERASTSQFVAHDDKEAVIELRGGAVLRSIADLMRRAMGDSEACNLYEELIAAASRPYLAMLEKWVTRGELGDPFEEFLIQETQAHRLGSSDGNVDDYWDKRYSVRAMDLPLQLSTPRIYNMLLVSGKYINVIRETRGSLEHSAELNQLSRLGLDKCRSVEDVHVVEAVSQAYKYANKTLLQLFSEPGLLNLRELLDNLRKVFFLHNSDLYDGFLSNAVSELRKPARRISVDKLEQALALAKDPEDSWSRYVTVSLSHEPLKDALLSVVATEDDAERYSSGENVERQRDDKLTGLDLVQFDFAVPFPLSLVISRRSIMRYQFLFRHIIELKAVHSILEDSWLFQIIDPRWKVSAREDSDAGSWVRRAGILRARKLQFVTDLLYHSTVDGMQNEYDKFVDSLDTIKEVSEVIESHIRFLDRSLMNCLLSDPNLLKIKSRLLSLCHQFVKFMNSNAEAVSYFSGNSEEPMLDDGGNEISTEDVLSWFAQTVERYEQAFQRNIKRFYDQLEAYMPTNFVAGGATLYLLQRLEPLLA